MFKCNVQGVHKSCSGFKIIFQTNQRRLCGHPIFCLSCCHNNIYKTTLNYVYRTMTILLNKCPFDHESNIGPSMQCWSVVNIHEPNLLIQVKVNVEPTFTMCVWLTLTIPIQAWSGQASLHQLELILYILIKFDKLFHCTTSLIEVTMLSLNIQVWVKTITNYHKFNNHKKWTEKSNQWLQIFTRTRFVWCILCGK